MTMLILTTEQAAMMRQLNASGPADRELAGVPLTNGRTGLPVSLLGDLKTWEHWAAFLEGLPSAEIDESELIKIPFPLN